MTDFHMHAIAICRHCGHSDTHGIHPDEAQASEGILTILAEAEKRSSLPVGTKINEISKGIFQVQWDKHDLIFTSMRCEEQYEACVEGFADYLSRRIAASKVMEAMEKMMNGEAAQFTETQDKARADDVASRLLSQLPDDFLKGLNN